MGNLHDYDYNDGKLDNVIWVIISLILIGLCGLAVLCLSAPLLLTIIAELIWG